MWQTLAAQVGNPLQTPQNSRFFLPFVEAWKGDAYATQEFCRHGGAGGFCFSRRFFGGFFFSPKNMQSCKDPAEFS